MTNKWQTMTLEKVLDLCDSGTWGDESSEGIPLLRSSNMQDGQLVLDDLKYINVPHGLRAKYILHTGDILLTKSSGSESHIGKSLYIDSEIDGKFGFSNFTQRLRPNKGIIEPYFLYLLISSPSTRQALLDSSRTTSGLRNLSIPVLKSHKLSIPSIAIQKDIASRMYEIEKLRAINRQKIKQTEELFECILKNIFDSKSGTKHIISDVAGFFQYGLSRSMNTNGSGTPILRINSIKDGKITDEDLKHLDVNDEELKKYSVNFNDILFNRTNSYELVGKTGIFKLTGTFVFASYLIRLVAKDKILPDYLNYFLNSSVGQAEIKKRAKRAVSQANVNAKELGSISIYVPEKSVQEEAVKKLDLIEQYLATLKTEKVRLTELFQSYLSKELS